MDYDRHLDAALQRLHDEGRYRTFIDIERQLDLEATAAFIHERNDWIEQVKVNRHTGTQTTVAISEQ